MNEDANGTEGMSPLDEKLDDSAAPATRVGRLKRGVDPRVGTTLDDRFVVKRLIARGGMGRIYEAEQLPLGRRVALKVMDLGYAEDLDPDFQKRFFLEASTCAGLSHPNTIRIFDYGSTPDDTYFIVMEYIEGETLLSIIDRLAPLPPQRVIHIARQICSSLAEAHGQGVIHRDLKPSNVLLTQHGEQHDFVKVLDFGLVKLMRDDAEEMTKSGLFLGSPNYMSPEQIRSNSIDQRADLYSLGVMLYMTLTAKSPFRRNTSVKVLLAQLEDPPPPFAEILPGHTIPPALEWVVMTCLAKSADERFANVTELSRALKTVSAQLNGELPTVQLELHEGKLVLPPEFEAIVSSIRWSPDAPVRGRSSLPADPIPSAGSLVSQRIRPEDLEQEQTGDRTGHSSRRRRGRKRGGLERLLSSRLLALFLTCMILVLLGVLAVLIVQLTPSPSSTVEEAPTEPLDSKPQTITIEDAPGLESEQSPSRAEATEAQQAPPPRRTSPAKPEPRRTPRSQPPRSSSSSRERATSDSAAASRPLEPAETSSQPEPAEAEPTPTPRAEDEEPDRSSSFPDKQGDLRDPWAD